MIVSVQLKRLVLLLNFGCTIALHQAVKFVSCIGLGRVGSMCQSDFDIGLSRRSGAAPWWVGPELSIGWVDTWVGLDWVEIFHFLVGWVGFGPL